MKDLTHDNINRFVGACLDLPHVCIVSSYCSRGSLKVVELSLNRLCEIYVNVISEICKIANEMTGMNI